MKQQLKEVENGSNDEEEKKEAKHGGAGRIR